MPRPLLEPILMRTFRDYGPRFGWFAYCQRCFHQSTLTPEDIARIGLDADVTDVRRCLRCGARDALLYRHYRGDMDKDGPNPFAHLVPACTVVSAPPWRDAVAVALRGLMPGRPLNPKTAFGAPVSIAAGRDGTANACGG